MNMEDIARMAREAGWDMEWGGTTVEQVMAFAEVVAAAEREACERFAALVLAEEREACARKVQDLVDQRIPASEYPDLIRRGGA